MVHKFRQFQKPLRRKASRFFLAFFWIFGFSSGVLIICRQEQIPLPELHNIATNPAQFPCLITVAVLPFLLSAIAVWFSSPACLLMLTGFDGLIYGAVSFLLIRSFGPGSWLVRLLLCFSITAAAPITYYFRLRHLSGRKPISLPELMFFLSLFFLLCSIDHTYISPLLARLFQ